MNKINGDIYRHVFQYNTDSHIVIGNIIPETSQVPCYNIFTKTVTLLSIESIFDCNIVRDVEYRDFQRIDILTSQYSQEAKTIRNNLFSHKKLSKFRSRNITPKCNNAITLQTYSDLDKIVCDTL